VLKQTEDLIKKITETQDPIYSYRNRFKALSYWLVNATDSQQKSSGAEAKRTIRGNHIFEMQYRLVIVSKEIKLIWSLHTPYLSSSKNFYRTTVAFMQALGTKKMMPGKGWVTTSWVWQITVTPTAYERSLLATLFPQIS